jgi:hypothetical protein
MAQVYDNHCAEGLSQFITGFTLSGFCGSLPGLSSEGCEFLLRHFQYVISGNYVAVLCVQCWGLQTLLSGLRVYV